MAHPDLASIRSQLQHLRPELITCLQTLVRTPSLGGHEGTAQHLVANELRHLGLAVEIMPTKRQTIEHHPAFCDDGFSFENRFNVVAHWNKTIGSVAGRSLILNGHIDVVPPGDEGPWTNGPWSGLVQNGKLYGRGACDMKGGIVAALFALKALKQLGFEPGADIIFESVVGEESGGVGTLTAIVNGVTADAAIIGEPTALKICPVQSGALTFRLVVRGKAIHACMKPYGVSAVEKFQLILNSITQLHKDRHASYHNPLYPDPNNVAPINIGTVHAGDWHSTVPDELVAEGRFGVLPGETVDDARQALQTAIANAAAQDKWLQDRQPELTWFEGQFESAQTNLASPIIDVLKSAYTECLGTSATLEGVTYGSDARLFTNHANTPAVLFGPGNIEQAHTVDEWIDLNEVLNAAIVIAQTTARWCGSQG